MVASIVPSCQDSLNLVFMKTADVVPVPLGPVFLCPNELPVLGPVRSSLA